MSLPLVQIQSQSQHEAVLTRRANLNKAYVTMSSLLPMWS